MKLPRPSAGYRNPFGPFEAPSVGSDSSANPHAPAVVRGLTWSYLAPEHTGARGEWCADGDGQIRVVCLGARHYLRTEWDALGTDPTQDDEASPGAPRRLSNQLGIALQQATSFIEVEHRDLFEHLGGEPYQPPRMRT